jgi:hypothetical protein
MRYDIQLEIGPFFQLHRQETREGKEFVIVCESLVLVMSE